VACDPDLAGELLCGYAENPTLPNLQRLRLLANVFPYFGHDRGQNLSARLASSQHVAVRKEVWIALERSSRDRLILPEQLLAAAEGRLPGSDPDERRWAGLLMSQFCYAAIPVLSTWGGSNTGGNAPLTAQEQAELREVCSAWRKQLGLPPLNEAGDATGKR
jgi:hypothetical protein